jgi:hypothetical protein
MNIKILIYYIYLYNIKFFNKTLKFDKYCEIINKSVYLINNIELNNYFNYLILIYCFSNNVNNKTNIDIFYIDPILNLLKTNIIKLT